MKRWKSILTVFLCGGILLLLTAVNLVKAPELYSLSERRALAQAPTLTADGLTSGRYMTDFENSAADQFPLRDRFRHGKAVFSKYVYRQKDSHGLYLLDGHLSRMEYPLNNERWEKSLHVLQSVCRQELAGTDCRVYVSLIPDKNTFLAPVGGYPVLNHRELTDSLTEALKPAIPIDLTKTLSTDSFYRTDPHWRQEKIPDTARALAEGMGAEFSDDFTEHTLDHPFYGAYYGQAALNIPPDTIRYLTDEVSDHALVTSYNTGKPLSASVYDMKKANGRDPYEMFLSGSDALLTIENPLAPETRELVLFRDSFGSSLAPLLLPGYSKITLVDLRYLSGERLSDYITFQEQDVLFLYSAMVLNSGAIS